jgi:hypothetical protein
MDMQIGLVPLTASGLLSVILPLSGRRLGLTPVIWFSFFTHNNSLSSTAMIDDPDMSHRHASVGRAAQLTQTISFIRFGSAKSYALPTIVRIAGPITTPTNQTPFRRGTKWPDPRKRLLCEETQQERHPISHSFAPDHGHRCPTLHTAPATTHLIIHEENGNQGKFAPPIGLLRTTDARLGPIAGAGTP